MYEKAHKGQHLPGLMAADHHGYVLDAEDEPQKTTTLRSGPGGESMTARCKLRVVTRDVGEPLENVKTLRQFLSVMYDVCVVQRNLFHKCRILHRDISDRNIMVAPANDEFYERCVNGYHKIPYLNQVLANNHGVKPKPACLVVDLGNGADLDVVQANPGALAARTGTPKFIARSVSRGALMPFKAHAKNQRDVSMPELEGPARDLYESSQATGEYERFTRMVSEGYKQGSAPQVQFAHRLFHDAESVYWVIAWVLTRSASPSCDQEEWTAEIHEFAGAMQTHQPGTSAPDFRRGVLSSAADDDYWKTVLHPDLHCMAPMLAAMSNYIEPEWAYRPELDADHVQEALMRLLLKEIVRIDGSEGGNIELAIGVRVLPTDTSKQSSHSCSTSKS